MSAGRLCFVAFLLYLGLDLSNPLVPGAVRFVGGVVESVEADRARDGEPATPRPAIPSVSPTLPAVRRPPAALPGLAPPPLRRRPALHRVADRVTEPRPDDGGDH